MLALRYLSVLLAAGGLAIACEEEHACTAIGCGFTHETKLEIDSTEPATELTIEACFNDACGSAVGPGSNAGVGIELMQGKLWVSASRAEANELSLSWSAAGSLAVKDGDRYAVRVKTSDGAVVVESVEIAESYSRSYPNGKECDGEGCLHVDSVRAGP